MNLTLYKTIVITKPKDTLKSITLHFFGPCSASASQQKMLGIINNNNRSQDSNNPFFGIHVKKISEHLANVAIKPYSAISLPINLDTGQLIHCNNRLTDHNLLLTHQINRQPTHLRRKLSSIMEQGISLSHLIAFLRRTNI